MDPENIIAALCGRIEAVSRDIGRAEAQQANERRTLEYDNRRLDIALDNERKRRDRYLDLIDKIEDALAAAGRPARAVATIRRLIDGTITADDRKIPRPPPF